MTEALDFFKKHGFSVIGTGGGCEALHREVDERYCLITVGEDGAEVPKNLNESVLVGVYKISEEYFGDDNMAIFHRYDCDSAEAMDIAKEWLDDCCEHPCERNGHRDDGRGCCAECNTFIS
jgi:hypothetical protein